MIALLEAGENQFLTKLLDAESRLCEGSGILLRILSLLSAVLNASVKYRRNPGVRP